MRVLEALAERCEGSSPFSPTSRNGRMAERPIALILKIRGCNSPESSNLSPSAKLK